MKTIGATAAKAHFLSVLKDVERKREKVTLTRNGRPVAQIIPMPATEEDDPIFGFYKGKLEIKGDIMSPLYSDEEQEEFIKHSIAQLG